MEALFYIIPFSLRICTNSFALEGHTSRPWKCIGRFKLPIQSYKCKMCAFSQSIIYGYIEYCQLHLDQRDLQDHKHLKLQQRHRYARVTAAQDPWVYKCHRSLGLGISYTYSHIFVRCQCAFCTLHYTMHTEILEMALLACVSSASKLHCCSSRQTMGRPEEEKITAYVWSSKCPWY